MNKDLLEESTKDQSAKYFFDFSSFQVFTLVLPIELVLGRAHSQLEFANKYRVMKKDKKYKIIILTVTAPQTVLTTLKYFQ